MRILGFIFLSLLLATGLVFIDFHLPGTYLNSFLRDHFIETFAGLVGFNIAAVIFLIGQLMNLEERFGGKNTFANTRREIKHNAYFLLSSFVSCLVLLIIRPDLKEVTSFYENIFFYVDNVLIITIFTLAIFAIYEILRAVFLLSKNDLS
ncbi:MAG: hypothetical protein KBD52_01050 [Candidatus Pacebacteria bacterium]|nr:hypothetical protein [Candidatus Paceibacterota bacterium]